MKQKFILVMSEMSLAAQKQMAEMFGEISLAFWHRLPNTWLIVSESPLDLDRLARSIASIAGQEHFLLFTVEPQRFISYMPPDWQTWFTKHWGSDPHDLPPEGLNATQE